MVPFNPTATKVLLPKVTPRSSFDVPEVCLVQVTPSVEVRMMSYPTATKMPLP